MARVSICIPCYNHEKFIGAAIESCLAQTERDIEVLVFNDRSTDGSADIVRGFSDPRVQLVENEERNGLVGNFNRALTGGTGAYVKILCADDYLERDCVKGLADALDRVPEAAFATSDRYMVYQDGRKKLLKPPFAGDVAIRGKDLVKRSWLCFNLVGEPTTVMVRRSAIQAVGGFDSRYHQMLDWELWLRLAARAPFVRVPVTLSSFRWHEENESVLKSAEAWAAYDLLRLSHDVAANPSTYPPVTVLQLKRLQILCAGRALLGCISAIIAGDRRVLVSCADLFYKSLISLFGSRPALTKSPFFARN